MSGTLFDDDFSTYDPNSNPQFPTGFNGQGIVFAADVIDTSKITPPSLAPGYYEKTGHIYDLFGSMYYFIQSTSVAFAFWNTLSDGIGTPVTIDFISGDPSTAFGILVAQMFFEPDGSVTLSMPPQLNSTTPQTINTLLPVFEYHTWMSYLFSVATGQYIANNVEYMYISGISFSANGVTYISNGPFKTNVPVANMFYPGTALFNLIRFNGPANGQLLSRIAGGDSFYPDWFDPDPVTPRHIYMSQVMTEYGASFENVNNIRNSQSIVEVSKASSLTNIRNSQSIVEIIASGPLFPGGGGTGFVVKES